MCNRMRLAGKSEEFYSTCAAVALELTGMLNCCAKVQRRLELS